MRLLQAACACTCTCASALTVGMHRLPHAPIGVRMQSSPDELGDGASYSTDGGTFFASWDGRDEEGISPEGMVPKGDDLVEQDLRRLFDVEGEGDNLTQGSEMDDLQLMFKLRKELGDEDFARIFEDPRIKGPSIF